LRWFSSLRDGSLSSLAQRGAILSTIYKFSSFSKKSRYRNTRCTFDIIAGLISRLFNRFSSRFGASSLECKFDAKSPWLLMAVDKWRLLNTDFRWWNVSAPMRTESWTVLA
jgi:hypothetical protein